MLQAEAEAERLVRDIETDLEAAADPTRRDIIETRLQAAMELQDEVLATVAPSIERRREELRDQAIEVAKSARGEVGSDWAAKYRCAMSPAVKSAVIRRYGAASYLALPWAPGRVKEVP